MIVIKSEDCSALIPITLLDVVIFLSAESIKAKKFRLYEFLCSCWSCKLKSQTFKSHNHNHLSWTSVISILLVTGCTNAVTSMWPLGDSYRMIYCMPLTIFSSIDRILPSSMCFFSLTCFCATKFISSNVIVSMRLSSYSGVSFCSSSTASSAKTTRARRAKKTMKSFFIIKYYKALKEIPTLKCSNTQIWAAKYQTVSQKFLFIETITLLEKLKKCLELFLRNQIAIFDVYNILSIVVSHLIVPSALITSKVFNT